MSELNSSIQLDAPRYRLFCGTWGSFPEESGLNTLTQTAANAAALSTAMATLGALEEDAIHVHDARGSECLNAVDDFLAAAENDVVLYFASHGLVPNGTNQFFRLATCETHDASDLVRSFVVAEVIDRLARSGPGRKFMIIDACYSGKEASSLLATPAMDLDLPSDICVLFSTDAFTAAKAPADAQLTAFTGNLSEVLAQGLPDRGPQLSVRSIFSHLRSAAESLEMPKPWLASTGTAAEMITFRNAANRVDGHEGTTAFGDRVTAFDHRTEILYVDDQENLRDQFQGQLERAGHSVTLAAGPIEAQQALAAGHFDIVVIDLLLVGDVPATEFIQLCAREASDSELFLVSRQTKGSEDLWDRLDSIFQYPSQIRAFLWKPGYITSITQHANRLRAKRRHTLAHVDGLNESVAAVAERIIARDPELGDKSERLQLEIRACIERLVEKWFPNEDDQLVYIESLAMRLVDGGRSSSVVFTLTPTLRGIDPESVTPLVLKIGPRSEIEEEVYRYDRYVQVGVPLDIRTDKIDSALVGNVGGVIYSFRGADDDSIHEVAQLSPAEINECLIVVFGSGNGKRWYASEGTGDGVLPLDHFTGLNFPPSRFKKALKDLQASYEKSIHSLPEDSPARGEEIEPAFESMTTSHDATLVHGDLSLQNLVQINDSRFAIIDYRTVGLGPRLIDFVTLEIACWLTAQAPETSRTQRLLDARDAVPRRLTEHKSANEIADWLQAPRELACNCRDLALINHKDATAEEYGSLLWLAAIRNSGFNSRATTVRERNTERALLPAIAIAAQAMIAGATANA